MDSLDNDLLMSESLIEDGFLYGKMGYGSVCLFSNENLDVKNDLVSYKNKKVLLPIASGDQYLSAKYHNSKEVVTYDINKLSKYIANLKIAGIKALSYEEFILFFVPSIFGQENTKFFNKESFIKLSKYLSDEDLKYFDVVLSYIEVHGYGRLINPNKEFYEYEDIIKECPYYANKCSYHDLKELLLRDSTVRHIISDIRSLDLEEEFDIVDLSNIISDMIVTSLYGDYGDYTLEELQNIYLQFINTKIKPLVKDGGSAFVDYVHHYALDSNLLFNSDEFEEHVVNSKSKDKQDLILKYTKK